MRRSRPPHVLLLLASAALALTGCSTGGSPAGERVPGAGGGGDGVAPRPGASAAAGVDRPGMRFPGDVRLVFEELDSGDPREESVYADAQNFVRAISFGIIKQNPRQEAYLFYSEFGSPAQRYANEQIEANIDQGYTLTGIQRYSEAEVRVAPNGRSAVASFCGDDSEVFSKEVVSGRVLRTEESLASHYRWNIGLVTAPDTRGLWRARQIAVEGSSRPCRGA